MRRFRRSVRRLRQKTSPVRWLRRHGLPAMALAAAVVVAAGAAGVGVLVQEGIGGSAGATVEQAVVIDRENLSGKDFRKGLEDRAFALNDENTSLTFGAEMAVGDELVLDVPLANLSDADANMLGILRADPRLRRDIETFWETETRSASPSSETSVPTPGPLTSVTPQPSDTDPATTKPTGSAGINPQVSDTTGTTSSPGLPESTPQASDAAAINTSPTGSAAVDANTRDLGTTASVASLSSEVADRSSDFTATATEPSGTRDVDLQQADATKKTSRPTGAADSLSDEWWQGTWEVDVDADGTKEDVHFVLSDPNTSGTYNTLDISSDDDTFGETRGGPLSGQSPRQTSQDDDERVTANDADKKVRLGSFYTFTVSFASTPDGTEDASIEAATWYTATVSGSTDLDGDGSADDTFHAVLTDSDSDGLYEDLDLSIGDDVFGEGGGADGDSNGIPDGLEDGEVDFGASDNANDERLMAAGMVVMGVNPFNFSFDTSPGAQ